MPPADDDLPNVPAANAEAEQGQEQQQQQTGSRFPQFETPVATVWRQVILSAGIAVLGFASFVLTLIWDQQLWLAAIAFPVGFVAALYALWLGMMLRRAEPLVP